MSTRLNININDECAASVQSYANANSLTVTEAVRHALSLLNYYDVQTQLGHRLAVVDADCNVVQVIGEEAS